MAEAKTKPTALSMAQFLKEKVPDADRRKDCEDIAALMEQVTKRPPVMWGPSIVGFGTYHFKYESGREGDFLLIGFSPRKSDLTLYGLALDSSPELTEKLGKFKRGKGCLYIKKLSDVHIPTLKALMKKAVDAKKKERVD